MPPVHSHILHSHIVSKSLLKAAVKPSSQRILSAIDCYKQVLAKKENFPIKIQALILKVLRSSFYSWVFRRSTTEIGEVSLKRLSGGRGWTLTEVLGLGLHHCYLADEFSHTTLYRVRKCMRELKNKGLTPLQIRREPLSLTDMPNQSLILYIVTS